MNVLHDLSVGNPPEKLNVFVEVPQGSKNKYEIDKETGLIFLDRVLPSAHVYPINYCFLPQTHWHDGDALDVLLFSTESFMPGTVVPSRPIALMHMIDAGDKDEKILCVPIDDPRFAEYQDLKNIPASRVEEITDFFETYKNLQKKKVEVTGFEGKDAAVACVNEGLKLYQDKFGK